MIFRKPFTLHPSPFTLNTKVEIHWAIAREWKRGGMFGILSSSSKALMARGEITEPGDTA